jgi:hypothetical protein
MSSSKKINLSSDFAAGVYLSEAHNPVPPPPLHTVFVYTVYLFLQGREKGGRVEPETRSQTHRGVTVHKAGSKIRT